MMNETNLQTILEAYALAAGGENDHKILSEMTRRYPEHAAALEDFAAARAVLRYASEAELSSAEEAGFREISLKNLRAVLAETNGAAANLESLTGAAQAKGLSRAKFAAALGLSVSLVQYLEKRRLQFASIPKKVIEKVAEVLETSEDLIAGYLDQSPVGAANASFKAAERPAELQPKSFAEAVSEDQTLSAVEKSRLLDL